MTTYFWTRQVNDHLMVEAHANDEGANLVLVRDGNRLWLELSEIQGLVEVLADEAARLAGVVAGDIEPGGGGNGGN